MFSNSQAILLSYQTRNRQEALHSSPPSTKVVSGYVERGPARVVLSLSGGTLWLLLGLRKTGDKGEVARPSGSLLNFHGAVYRIRYFLSNDGQTELNSYQVKGYISAQANIHINWFLFTYRLHLNESFCVSC